IAPFLGSWSSLTEDLMSPFSLLPKHPFLMAHFGMKGLRPARQLASSLKTKRARALFAGLAAHSIMPFDKWATAAIGLVLAIEEYIEGWPYPKGGSHALTRVMGSYLEALGGKIETDTTIHTLDVFPEDQLILFNNTPYQILDMAGDRLSASYTNKLKNYQYGSGVFKVDLALSEEIPWKDELCKAAGTVHVGGTFEEIAATEKATANGKHPNHPYVLVAQQSLFDTSRAPGTKHTGWAYCHVPNGSTKDMSEPVLNQIERYAPGFRDCILEMHCMNTRALESYNPNYVGGDINGGRQNITQLFTRPAG